MSLVASEQNDGEKLNLITCLILVWKSAVSVVVVVVVVVSWSLTAVNTVCGRLPFTMQFGFVRIFALSALSSK